jgi:lysophospholipase L1-like esterase
MIDLPALMEANGLAVGDLVNEDGLHLSYEGNQHYAELIHQGLAQLGALRKKRR